jgi:hypothetical protein
MWSPSTSLPQHAISVLVAAAVLASAAANLKEDPRRRSHIGRPRAEETTFFDQRIVVNPTRNFTYKCAAVPLLWKELKGRRCDCED